MEELHVAGANFAMFALNIVLAVGMFLALLLFCRKRLGGSLAPFWVGCGTFLLFAMVLESICHNVFLRTEFGERVFASIWGYAIYGGLAAGVFEETGRFVAMKWLKKKHNAPNTDLKYGAGHGGIEVLLVLGVTMAQYIAFGAMINAGETSQLLEPMDEASRAAAVELFCQIAAPVSYINLLAVVERIFAVGIHISLSVLVWQAVTVPGRGWLYPAAIVLHALTDGLLVVAMKLGAPTLAAEGLAGLCMLALVLLAKKLRASAANVSAC